MDFATQLTQLVGNTPMLRLDKTKHLHGCKAEIFAKLEYFNPAGSVKDRVALAMVEDAERRGLLKPGATIIEPTSGNTGIGLAFVCAVKGYRLMLVMPDTMSVERRMLLKAYGAEVVLTPGAQGMSGSIAKAEQLRSAIDGAVILQQFDNRANQQAHYLTTGVEILRQCAGLEIDYFVAGVGTGGTISGVGRRLREKFPDVKIVAVEPSASPVISGGKPGPHAIQGIGAGFIPGNLDLSLIDEVILIDNDDAMSTSRALAREEGVLVGISSGAAMAAALKIALREECAGKNIVTLFPDGGDRYLSTPLFQE